MIVGIASVRNEEAIIANTVSHHLATCDHIIISDGHSTDDTRAILTSFDNVTTLDQDGPFDQQIEMMRLVKLAKQMGATWVVPFDADEFWVGLDQLRDLDDSVCKVFADVYGHTTFLHRHINPRGLPKVCFRDASHILWGNHDADGCGTGLTPGPTLTIRELQYQSYAHFLAKIDKAAALYASYSFPFDYGVHMRELVAMTPQQRDDKWAQLQSIPTVTDPIPYLGDVPWT